MAPKKKPQKQKNKSQSSSSSSSPAVPRLQISAENENRLRRLLLNSDRSTQPPSSLAPVRDSLSKAQKAKKLTTIYEKLSCEGFSNHHIELALTSLKENATFESALDWLCLNLPGNELPLKFSSGTSLNEEGGTVGVVLTGHKGRIASVDLPSKVGEVEEEMHVSVRIKGQQQQDDQTLDAHHPSQSDWIRQYLLQQQQEEEASNSWEDDEDDRSLSLKGPEARPYDIIAKEYHAARLDAAKAKEGGDKKRQEQASRLIRKLKQELSDRGFSDNILASDFEHERASVCESEEKYKGKMFCERVEAPTSSDAEAVSDFDLFAEESKVYRNDVECSSTMEYADNPNPSNMPVEEKVVLEKELADMELGDFFLEDRSKETLPVELLDLQRKEKMKELSGGKNLDKLDGIWKKGDPQRIPKAVLQQLCQKSGWEAPKFSKILEKGRGFSYTISILRKASGRGKSRKAGGLVTIQLPDQDETFVSTEDAQNKVAAFALIELFPNLPIHVVITEPYASLVLQWKRGASSSKVDNSLESQRAGFVDWLLNAGSSTPVTDVEASASNGSSKTLRSSRVEEVSNSIVIGADPITERVNYTRNLESTYLRHEQEKKHKIPKYKEILTSRTSLPISGLKDDILKTLREKDVVVVCGETGSGKTTQVPQFILDDMIESGNGGFCNIICTQPRRIAAISVAERVSDERCESSPGSDGSLVGYQVRLDSARNEKTKLLFCTTGILLRKLAGDRNLTDVTHVIVDEVHERSLLADFLLIILKNLIEKKSSNGTSNLKVILMSATVDSGLFASYFGNCPVLTAIGRAHPVTTYFLEDVYESINYVLDSDSPASLRYQKSTIDKSGPVNNRRGKKNLVLSGWGDDSMLSEDCVNPYYVSSNFESYTEQTRKNLKRLNEEFIDYDLLEDLICYVDETCEEGAILVFLPGASEIYTLVDRLIASYRFGGPSCDWVLPLHSSIASIDQKKVFMQPPKGIRKVIIATNIAETSITIDDVLYVIDCGKHKENRYDPRKKLSCMVEDWISQANARQRRGRAGRVKPGTCFCLYTRHRFEKLMRPYQVPEMLRMPLVELCLQIKLLSLGHIKPFLSKALEPPKEESITSAVSLLYEVVLCS
ncbi:hypothetical protein K2173_022223 [Erythroxylum novogranatense]|uniref:RNA helicase n=1 Tax=Erythroxylum novogranatense TaxID=1862640 RepID=A0AAV8SUL3_9ROSI|nr:hypothetical protein K2173_022223 [Erythroxylum novogranatense]